MIKRRKLITPNGTVLRASRRSTLSVPIPDGSSLFVNSGFSCIVWLELNSQSLPELKKDLLKDEEIIKPDDVVISSKLNRMAYIHGKETIVI